MAERNVQVVFSPHLLKALDLARGTTTRQDYVRWVLGKHLDVPVVGRRRQPFKEAA